ncbi:hypothetical protein ACOMHN_027959 [Nucella lapillus]
MMSDMSTMTNVSTVMMNSSTRDVLPSASPPASASGAGSLTFWEKLLRLSEDQVQLAAQIQTGLHWVLLPLALLLTICNILVFLHPSMASSARFYVVSLSYVQVFNLSIDLINSLIQKVLPNPYDDRGYWIFSLYFAIFFSAVSRRGSYVVTCLLSLERLYAILRPLHLKSFLLSRALFF